MTLIVGIFRGQSCDTDSGHIQRNIHVTQTVDTFRRHSHVTQTAGTFRGHSYVTQTAGTFRGQSCDTDSGHIQRTVM